VDVIGYAFAALTTSDLARARWFWVDQLEFPVTEEQTGHPFVLDAGTLRLHVEVADGDVHRAGSTDPVIGFAMTNLATTLAALSERGLHPARGPVSGADGSCAELRDPDGRAVVLSEAAA
jgi:catechol 2,3-dioxygenase-like lactoylglutathione lyase family enzyme